MIIKELRKDRWQYDCDQYIAVGIATYMPESDEELNALIDHLKQVFQVRKAVMTKRTLN
jgi:hypothetical protein